MRNYLVLIILSISACATTPQSTKSNASVQSVDSEDSFTKIVEIAAADHGGYNWRDRTWSVAELRSALIVEDKRIPISEIRLLQGDNNPSILQSIEVGSLAEAVGAKAFYVRDGELKSIIMVK